jgi:hypothetical protein
MVSNIFEALEDFDNNVDIIRAWESDRILRLQPKRVWFITS